jgi:hypothetical protein
MRHLLIACLILFAPRAMAASNDTLTITYTSYTGGSLCASGCSKTLSGPAGVNVLALMVATYQASCNATLVAPATCTPAQVMAWWASSVGAKLANDISAYQQNAASAAVVATPVQ